MEPGGESVDLPKVKQMDDLATSMDAVEELEVKPLAMEVEPSPSAAVSDATDSHSNPGVKVENGGRSPSSFPSALCAEEGLAGRIGLVELGKGSDAENGKGCHTTASTSATQPSCSTTDSCAGTENNSGTPYPPDNADNLNAVNASKSTELKGELDAVDSVKAVEGVNSDLAAMPNGTCGSETADAAPRDSSNPHKGTLSVVESPSIAEKGCVTEGQPVLVPDTGQGVSNSDVGAKDSSEEPCVLHSAVGEPPCPDGSAKKRRVDCSVSEAEGNKAENEVAGDQWRKRRKRKSRRKAPNVSVSPSSVSSSGDERETSRRSQQGGKQSVEDAGVSEDEQQFCLRWNNFLTNITSQFGTLRDDEDFVDVTLACGGMHVKAHRVVLSACSPYFKRMFKSVPYCQHPVVFLEGINPSHLLSLLAFMYCGEVGVGRGQLPSLLSAAHALQIRGLTEMGSSSSTGSARGDNSGGEDEEERVILSARRQAMAVEKVLKDIGFSEVAGARGGCIMNLPKSASVSGEHGVSSATLARQKRLAEGSLLRAEGVGGLSNGLGEPQADGHGARGGTVPVPTGPGLNEEDEEEGEGAVGPRCNERRRWSNMPSKNHCPSPVASSRLPLVPGDADVPLSSPCAKKVPSSRINCAVTSEDSANRVNPHHPDTLLMCNMAASLVDVHMVSSPAGEEEDDGRTKDLREPASSGNPSSRSSPSPKLQGTGMERHGWDPGEGGLRGATSHFEPRIDLVMGTGLIKPKEEFPPFGSDVEDISLPNAIEPKMEYQEVSGAEEGETSCGVPQVAAPSGPSLSLVSHNDHHQLYRPHVLSSPIVGVMTQQQQPRPSPSSSSSHVFSHFLPPMAPSSGTAPSVAVGERRAVVVGAGGGGDSVSAHSGGAGHLKWEMPRPCPVCRRIYSNNSNLRRHLRTIHEEYYEAHMQ